MNNLPTLRRHQPARTKVQRFRWIKREFMEMSPRYREIRAKTRSKLDACFWCRHSFEDGEMMALASPEKGLNKVLCQNCAREALEKP